MNRKSAPIIVFDDEGVVGFLDPGTVVGEGTVRVHLEGGQSVALPGDALVDAPDGRVRLLVDRAELENLPPEEAGDVSLAEAVIPVVVEEVEVSKRKVDAGKVRVTKGVTTREETVDVPLISERVEVERVPINRPIDGPMEIRHEGDLMIIPIIEEVLVVEKRLILKEELRIRRHRVEERKTERVTLRSETASVERD